MDTHTDKVAFDMRYPQNIQLTLTERQNSMCYIIMQSFKNFVSCSISKIFYLSKPIEIHFVLLLRNEFAKP